MAKKKKKVSAKQRAAWNKAKTRMKKIAKGRNDGESMGDAMNVPVIDIAGFKSGSASERRAIALQVDQAATDVGFMQIAGHGIHETVATGLAGAIDGFFALPPAEKLRWHPPSVGVNRGH